MERKLFRTSSIQTSLLALSLVVTPLMASAQTDSADSFLPAIMLLLDEEVCNKNDDGPDFNGDGCADLAIGAPLAKVSPDTGTN